MSDRTHEACKAEIARLHDLVVPANAQVEGRPTWREVQELAMKLDVATARLDRVAALRVKWENDWITSGSVPAAGAIRNCTFELLKALSDEGNTP